MNNLCTTGTLYQTISTFKQNAARLTLTMICFSTRLLEPLAVLSRVPAARASMAQGFPASTCLPVTLLPRRPSNPHCRRHCPGFYLLSHPAPVATVPALSPVATSVASSSLLSATQSLWRQTIRILETQKSHQLLYVSPR